jgi:micrococcal nuclease
MNPDRNLIPHSKATTPVAFFFGGAGRIVFALWLVLCLATGVLAGEWRVAVSAVLDGDTLVLKGGERLRLRGIDAPEVSHKGKAGQYYGRKSAQRLAALVSGQTLVLDRDELNTDRYGRLVGVARLSDGRIVNLLMIEHGAAFVYPHPSDKDQGLARRLLAAQITAMSRGAGFWPELLGSPGAGAGFVGTKNSRRFHVLTCRQGRTISPANRVFFSSLREAFAAGYAPARECTPWPMDMGR